MGAALPGKFKVLSLGLCGVFSFSSCLLLFPLHVLCEWMLVDD